MKIILKKYLALNALTIGFAIIPYIFFLIPFLSFIAFPAMVPFMYLSMLEESVLSLLGVNTNNLAMSEIIPTFKGWFYYILFYLAFNFILVLIINKLFKKASIKQILFSVSFIYIILSFVLILISR